MQCSFSKEVRRIGSTRKIESLGAAVPAGDHRRVQSHIASLLQEESDDAVSGREMGRAAGLSRSAVSGARPGRQHQVRLLSALRICLPAQSHQDRSARSGCSKSETKSMFKDTDKSEFKVGQVWNYRTRPGEENSTLVVLKVETAPGWKTIVHIGVTGVKLKTAKGIQDTVPHLPIDEAAL